MKRILLFITLLLVVLACTKTTTAPQGSLDYFPLQVGNYWKVDNNDYLEIMGKKTLDGKEYFQIHSNSTQWGSSYFYVRLDEKLNLIQAFDNAPNYTKVIANFGLKKGNQIEHNIEEATVIEKDNKKITFRYRCLVCSMPNATFDVSFHKGLGLLSRNAIFGGYIKDNPLFKEIHINGKTIFL